jgi:hypothetical protein
MVILLISRLHLHTYIIINMLSLRLLRASASLRQKPGLYLTVNLEQLQQGERRNAVLDQIILDDPGTRRNDEVDLISDDGGTMFVKVASSI